MKAFKVAPLSNVFMMTSMLGFIISAWFIIPASKSWGFALVIIFLLMFIASVISMSKAPVEAELQVDKKRIFYFDWYA